MADYHTQYKGQEGETTEWEDIHIRLGNMPQKPKPPKPPEYQPDQDDAKAGADTLKEVNTVDELDDLEDEFDDDPYLEELRQRRIAELKKVAQQPRYSGLQLIRGSEFINMVTEASHKSWVVMLLFKDGDASCATIKAAFEELASRYPATRFVSGHHTDIIPGYPDANLPTVLVYSGGACKATIMGMTSLGGPKTNADGVALALNKHGKVCWDEQQDKEGVESAQRRHAKNYVLKIVEDKLVNQLAED